MSIESRSSQYGSLFGDWHIRRMLGTGSGGRSAVFELYRDNNGWEEYSALKVINLIEEYGTRDSLSDYRQNEYSTAVLEQRQKAEQEVRLMEQLRGKTNIVDYLDHQFFSWSDDTGFGVDLLIRMEKLTDLRSQLRSDRVFSESEIVKIGKDICQALVICHSKNIIHRDIKPENIFFNSDMDYKLGDFGVSRIMDSTTSAIASTGIGTVAYCAPEQFSGSYDRRVDIYSFGLVLYELANGKRLPFATSGYAGQDAIQSRFTGKPLPYPSGLQPNSALARIILKACSYAPENRFSTAEEMLAALNALPCTPEHNTTASLPEYPTSITTGELSTLYTTPPITGPLPAIPAIPPKKPSRIPLIAALSAGIGILVLLLVFLGKPTPHQHTWTAATCEAPRTCTECGETEGSALGHQWQDATCVSPRSCGICGAASGDALGHQWAEANCDTPKTCTTCGATSGDALGHRWTDASCTSPKTCDICGQTTGNASGHTWIAATETAPETCAICGLTVGEPLAPAAVYLNTLSYLNKYGKLWTMSEETPAYHVHTDISDGSVYDDMQTQGHTTGPVYDYLGNKYTYGLTIDGNEYAEYSITYAIGGAYTTLSGVCSMSADMIGHPRATENKKYFEVWGDGVLLFRSVDMIQGVSPQKFIVDVTGVSLLTIRYPKSSGPSRIATIYDAKLS